MKRAVPIFFLVLCCTLLRAQEKPVCGVFWNLENFFDWRDGGGGDADREFSAGGGRHWTRKRFETKARAVAKALLWIADREGALPDWVGLAEVENRFVLKRLLDSDALCKTDYGIVHFESPDPRGIDVALLYRTSVFSLAGAGVVRVKDEAGEQVATRNILYAKLKRDDDSLAVLICHLPSKYGGVRSSAGRRKAAVACLKAVSDSLAAAGMRALVVMGDFNDTPDHPVFSPLSPGLANLALPLHERGEGTIRYQGRWEMIDQA